MKEVGTAAVLGLGFLAACLLLAGLPPALAPVLGYGLAVALGLMAVGAGVGLVRRRRYLGALRTARGAEDGDWLPSLETPGLGKTEREWERLARDLRRFSLEQLEDERSLRREQADFFTQWVHQVKTPVSVLKLLAEGRSWPEVAAEAERIEVALRLALGFSRLSNLADDFLVRDVDLLDLCRRAVEPYRPVIREKGLTVLTAGDWVPVPSDSKWLLFLLDQLVSNAVKYTPAGGTIRFTSASAASWEGERPSDFGDRGRILAVADSGPGIPSEDLARVGNRSFTGHRGRQDLTASGMGLWLARRMAQALGIRLGLRSSPAEGTTVYLGFGM